ncbi:hypothetical protein K440DRAFT_661718 [Wilcoxina mikolae CBS 423.85]|nr:hypothetical protein K440DRAFT_661718 [Wilcoxina mikolae CBS 423.85]
MEFLGAIAAATSILIRSVAYTNRLRSAREEQHLSQQLIETINEIRNEVINRRGSLNSQLSETQKQRIDAVISRTGEFVVVVQGMLDRTADGQTGQLLWALRDKNRVMTYQTVLGCLHGALIAINDQLRGLECRDHGADGPPNYSEIYSTSSREKIVAGLERWAKGEVKNEGDIFPQQSEAMIVEDFRKYTEQSRRAMVEEFKRRKTERQEVEKASEIVYSGDAQRRMAVEMRRRLKERRNSFHLIDE